MDNTAYIDSYFKGISDNTQTKQFEKKILEDPVFAEEVAFYISANSVVQQQLQEEKKQRFRELYDQQKVVSIRQPLRNMWKYMAAASVLIAAIVLTWVFSGDKASPKQLADKYIQQNFTSLGVAMGDRDSMQKALDLSNSGKLTEALAIFETLSKNDPGNGYAKKYAGIVSLRLKEYDKALRYFSMIESDTSYSNWGKFYKALTLLERDKKGDIETAKILLQQVRDNELEGKKEAEEWLKKIE